MKFLKSFNRAKTRLAVLAAMVVLTAAARSYPVDREVLDGTAAVLGRAGVAELVLAYGFKGEAQANIKSALDTTDQLKTHASKFGIDDPLLFGRLTYKVGGAAGECFLPLLHGQFSTPLLTDKLLKLHAATGAELTDAFVVKAHVFIDLTALKKDLQQAEEALKTARPDQAVAALNDITDNALTVSDPDGETLETASENLMFTQQLLHSRDFKAAAFANEHARAALAGAAKTDPALQQKAAETAKVLKGLTDLGDALRSGKLVGQKPPEAGATDLLRQLDALAPKAAPVPDER